MEIETQVTFKDNLRANYFLSYTNPLVILLCIMGLAMIYILIADYTQISVTSERGSFLALLLVIYIYLGMPLMVYIRTKRYYRSHKNLQKPITYEFTEEGVELKSKNVSSSYPWENVYKVRESKSLFYIYQSKAVANLIPKRFFTPQQIIEFRELVKRKDVKANLKSK